MHRVDGLEVVLAAAPVEKLEVPGPDLLVTVITVSKPQTRFLQDNTLPPSSTPLTFLASKHLCRSSPVSTKRSGRPTVDLLFRVERLIAVLALLL